MDWPTPLVTKKLASKSLDALKQRFFALGGDAAQWKALAQKHNETHRAYHNLSHLHSLFQLADALDCHTASVQWAIFYHDIIYQPLANDNEAQSAAYFKQNWNGPNNQAEDIHTLIIATQKHQPLLGTQEEACFLDMDMAILAAPREVYAQYAHAVRAEYAYIADNLYQKGRGIVLQHFLAQENLYLTPLFQTDCQAQARANIEWELTHGLPESILRPFAE